VRCAQSVALLLQFRDARRESSSLLLEQGKELRMGFELLVRGSASASTTLSCQISTHFV
jgi:hypothetical protein